MTQSDFVTAREGYTPLSLKGVSLFHSTTAWKDIGTNPAILEIVFVYSSYFVGGLWEVKKTLKETIEWPSRYAFLYNSSPLRTRSGLLLYGPPGYN